MTILDRLSSPVVGVPVVAAVLIGAPLLLDAQIPRTNSFWLYDVSDSNQKNKVFVEQICRDSITQLKDGDYLWQAKFADKLTGTGSFYESRQKSTLQEKCKTVMLKPPGIGALPGTDIMGGLERLSNDIKHQEVSGNHKKVTVVLVIDSAEPGAGQPPLDLAKVKAIFQGIVKDDRGAIVVVVSATTLESGLSETISDIPHVSLCDFENAKSCVNTTFSSVRQS